MIAYGLCHICGQSSGSDPYNGKPIPTMCGGNLVYMPPVKHGFYDEHSNKWECYEHKEDPRSLRARKVPDEGC